MSRTHYSTLLYSFDTLASTRLPVVFSSLKRVCSIKQIGSKEQGKVHTCGDGSS